MNYTAKGALHIHTAYSDGTDSIRDIAKAAKKSGLDWIIITDHNTLKGKEEEGFYDEVLVLVGEEVSPDLSNHCLAFNTQEAIGKDCTPEEYLAMIKEQGGLSFVAHPDENINRKNKYKPLRWTNWDIRGFDGLEIWNYLSDWVDNYDTGNPVKCFFHRNTTITGPTQNTMKWWDELNNETLHIISAVGGQDVHALKYKFFGITFTVFPYDKSFDTVTNCLILENKLSKDFNEARSQVYEALKKGQNIIINRHWGQNNFEFYMKHSNQKAFAGSEIALDNDLKLFINTPKKANIKIFCNGELLTEHFGTEFTCQIKQSGKYRAEVYYKNYPWIFTNPILVKKINLGKP